MIGFVLPLLLWCVPSFVSVTDFGAIPDDLADDTVAVQAAVDASLASGKGGTVFFPPGKYRLRSVDLRPGLTLTGPGATLVRAAGQGKWERMLTTQRRPWRGPHDSPPLVISDLRFDGNRREQGEYRGYELEQQHLLFLAADPDSEGRLVARVERCTFVDAVADGVSIGPNVDALVQDVIAEDVFRGAVVLHGGNSELVVRRLVAGGEEHWTGVDVEVDGRGFGGSKKVEVLFDQLLLDGDFDVALTEGSRLVARNVRTSAGGFNLYARDSHVHILDSSFAIGPRDARHRIYYPNDVTIERTRFVAREDEPVEADRELALVDVLFRTRYFRPTGQSLRLIDVDFEIGEGVDEADTVYAVSLAAADTAADRNRLVLDRVRIAEGFDFGVHLRQGGTASLRDVRIGAATAIFLAASPGYDFDVRLERVEFESTVEVAEEVYATTPASRLEHRDVVLDAGRNRLLSRYGVGAATFEGRRTIRADRAPAEAPGFAGDLWLVESETGEVLERWECLASDTTRARWVALGL